MRKRAPSERTHHRLNDDLWKASTGGEYCADCDCADGRRSSSFFAGKEG